MGLFDGGLGLKRREIARYNPLQKASSSVSVPEDSTFSESLHPPGIFNPPRFHQTDSNVTLYGRGLVPFRSTYDHHKALPIKVEFEGGITGTKLTYEGTEGSRETYGAGKLFEKALEQEAVARDQVTKEKLAAAEFEKDRAEERKIRAERVARKERIRRDQATEQLAAAEFEKDRAEERRITAERVARKERARSDRANKKRLAAEFEEGKAEQRRITAEQEARKERAKKAKFECPFCVIL